MKNPPFQQLLKISLFTARFNVFFRNKVPIALKIAFAGGFSSTGEGLVSVINYSL
jgi:hypothetical protein